MQGESIFHLGDGVHLSEVQIWEPGECIPNYEFWRRASYWTVEEGVALFLDKEPRLFNSEALKDAPRDHPTVNTFFEWLELATRATHVSRLSTTPTPEEFLEWRKALGADWNRDEIQALFLEEQDDGNPLSAIDYMASYFALEAAYQTALKRNQELQDELDEHAFCMLNSDFEIETKPRRSGFDDRQRKSLLKIVLPLAISKYRFNPKFSKNAAPKNMEGATTECGLTVTDETIRNHLKEAVQLFPEILDLFENE